MSPCGQLCDWFLSVVVLCPFVVVLCLRSIFVPGHFVSVVVLVHFVFLSATYLRAQGPSDPSGPSALSYVILLLVINSNCTKLGLFPNLSKEHFC